MKFHCSARSFGFEAERRIGLRIRESVLNFVIRRRLTCRYGMTMVSAGNDWGEME